MSFLRRFENAAYPYAQDEAFRVRLAQGRVEDRMGDRFVDATACFLSSLSGAIAARSTACLESVMRSAGRVEGARCARDVSANLTEHYGFDSDELPLVQFLAGMSRAWSARGMGRLTIETEWAELGVFVLHASDLCSPMTAADAKHYAGAFLASCFSELSEEELDTCCVQSDEQARTTFVLTGAQRLADALGRAAEGAGERTLDGVLSLLGCEACVEALR